MTRTREPAPHLHDYFAQPPASPNLVCPRNDDFAASSRFSNPVPDSLSKSPRCSSGRMVRAWRIEGRPVVEERRHLLPRRERSSTAMATASGTSRPDRARRLPCRPRRHLHLADAVLSRRPSGTTAMTSPTTTASIRGSGPGGLHRVRHDGRVARHEGHRRPRRQPHVGPASVVPGGALQTGFPYRDYYIWTDTRRTNSPRSSFPASRPQTGRTTRRRSSTTSTTSTRISPTSTPPALKSPTRSKNHGLLAPARHRRVPRRRGTLPHRAKG